MINITWQETAIHYLSLSSVSVGTFSTGLTVLPPPNIFNRLGRRGGRRRGESGGRSNSGRSNLVPPGEVGFESGVTLGGVVVGAVPFPCTSLSRNSIHNAEKVCREIGSENVAMQREAMTDLVLPKSIVDRFPFPTPRVALVSPRSRRDDTRSAQSRTSLQTDLFSLIV